jgi:hypothetical protein
MSMDYPGNVLNALNDGCVMDLRVRLAIQFIVGGMIPVPPGPDCVLAEPSQAVAFFALDVAERLVALGVERGYIAAMPEGHEIPGVVKSQVKRSAEAQAIAQHHGAKVLRDLDGPLGPINRSPISMHG